MNKLSLTPKQQRERDRSLHSLELKPDDITKLCNRGKAALSYARRGWKVLPLYTIKDGACTCAERENCNRPGKHPLFGGGVHGATADLAEVERLWRENRYANVGIATGAVSGFIAVDADLKSDGIKTFNALKRELGAAKATITADTGGGGFHRLYAYPGESFSTRRRTDLPGIDVQSDGAYIVVPPSRHISGKRYAWRDGRDPDTASLAKLPDAWIARFQKPSVIKPATQASGAVGEGGRNVYLTQCAGKMRSQGSSPEAIAAALMVVNKQECNPPLDEVEVEKIAMSVGRYPIPPASSGDEAETVMRMVLDHSYSGGAHLLRASDGRFWTYSGTQWAPLDRQVLSGKVLAVIQGIPNRRGHQTLPLVKQVVGLLEAYVAPEGDPLRFNGKPPPVVNCRNGELWIGEDGSVELRPHRADSFLRVCLDVDYDPAASCPRYDQALAEIFENAENPDELVDFLHDIFGYAVQADRRTPAVVLMWGEGSNGKTATMETFVRLVGRERVAAMPIGDIEKSRFAVANLLGKLAIIDDDVKSGTRLPDDHLKRLSEEKTVSGENKFGPTFQFTCRTAIFMLFNNAPSLGDLSHGMQRRITVIPFQRKFEGDGQDRKLFRTIWETELSGVLNRYLEGLSRVIRRGWSFGKSDDAARAKSELMQAANPVPGFVKDCCKPEGSAYVQRLYEAYCEWADAGGITKKLQRLTFQRALVSMGFKLGRGNAGPKLRGISIRGS